MTARRGELAAFLRAARERVRPADVGLPDLGRRRTPGLRRQEVAELAAVSIDWYVRLEQGRVGTPGSAVLDGIAAALLLSPAERVHLHLIARGEAPPPPHVPAPLSGSLRAVLDGMPLLPAYVMDFRFDVLACNAAASALFGPEFGHGRMDNTARMLFLVPETRETNVDWAAFAREMVGNLRANQARYPDDPRLAEVVAELRAASRDFAAWWDDRHVHERSRGRKRIRHAAAGVMTVDYDMLAALDGSDQRLFVLTPADGASERALRGLVTAHATALASAG
ncbi:helix-turn-helix transcriptional regulator [Actinomadura nitritigenes]|uniref:Helix-turn-helix domain-containing protein n=1 Tax=Actinomadura nitritigenes TaxID=134602 RepID=A0ABS3RD17_9ACTN|nr:helix-turn-helix transcriptional regulator [Actinomadura nitritigenes]MBO2444124.1 helix-turn-helix domain-containing protein [Actinomadura nitritigenes]